MLFKNKSYDIIFITLCTLIMIIPSTISVFNVSQTKILCLMIGIVFLYILIYNQKKILQNIDIFIIFTCVFSIINIFILFLKSISNTPVYFNEIFDSIRYLFFSMFYLLICIYNRNKENGIILVKILCVLFLISALIGISQYFNFLNLNELYVPKIAPTQFETLMPEYLNKRIIGLNSNPTVFGFNMILGVIVNIIYIQFIDLNQKNKYIIFSLIEIVALLMTNSRTTQISFITMICIMYFIYCYINYGKKYAFKHFCIFTLGVTLITIFILPKDLTWRLVQMFDINNVTSWSARIIKWHEYFDIINQHLLLGIGPIKNLGLGYIDSEWIQILLQSGIIGLLSYITIIVAPIFLFKHEYKKLNIYLGLLTAVTLYNLASTTLLNYEIAFKFFVIIAILKGIKDYNQRPFGINYDGTALPINKSKPLRKIIIIATYFPPMGGVGVFRVSKFVKYLPKYGFLPVVVTLDNSHYSHLDYNLLINIPDNIKIYRLKMKHINKDISYSFYKQLKRNIYKIIKDEQPDHVFITGGPFYILPIARFIYNNYQIPYTIDLRDPWSLQKRLPLEHDFKSFKLKIAYIVEDILERYSLSKAKNIVTVNETMTNEYIIKYPRYKEKFHTITNGVDLCDFENISDISDINKNTIIYTGKFGVSAGFRNPETLFACMSQLESEGYYYSFIHIGPTDSRVVELAKQYNIINNCKFLGVKSYNETISYCKSSNILLVIGGSEKSEQTGKIFDYMGCKRNVLALCRQDGEIAKICKNMNNFYTCALNDKDYICSVLKKLYDSDSNPSEINHIYTRIYLAKKLSEII